MVYNGATHLFDKHLWSCVIVAMSFAQEDHHSTRLVHQDALVRAPSPARSHWDKLFRVKAFWQRDCHARGGLAHRPRNEAFASWDGHTQQSAGKYWIRVSTSHLVGGLR